MTWIPNSKSYFDRLLAESPTRVWVNNPTIEDVDLALAQGAVLGDHKPFTMLDGLTTSEFEAFGPVQHFRNSFIMGRNVVRAAVAKERRALVGTAR